MELESDSEKDKEKKLSFTIPQIHPKNTQSPKLEFEIIQDQRPFQKLEVEIKRELQKSTQDYLEILKKLNILLNSHSITEAQRRDYCKSQRYFMKLYLDKIKNE